MSLLDILAGPVKGLLSGVSEIFDEAKFSGEEKAAAKQKLAELELQFTTQFEETLRRELEAKERIIVAELAQDDKFTKRARPMVVYVGLGAFLFNYVIVPNLALLFGTILTPVEFPKEFWYGWSGIVATWAVGRTVEKRAMIQGKEVGRFTKILTG